MVLVMDDVQHLQLIKSPFTPLALLKKLDPTIVRYLGSKFPVTVSSPVQSLHDEQSFWQYLAWQLLKNSTALVLRGGDRLAETAILATRPLFCCPVMWKFATGVARYWRVSKKA